VTYKPPIKQRSTDDLLKIVDNPNNWEDDALRIARIELNNRGFSTNQQIRRAKSTNKFKRKVKDIKRNESYSYTEMILLFIFAPFTFAWFIPSGMGVIELENEGYLKKRNQRFLLILYTTRMYCLVYSNLSLFVRKKKYNQYILYPLLSFK
jgi:reverse gyrase